LSYQQAMEDSYICVKGNMSLRAASEKQLCQAPRSGEQQNSSALVSAAAGIITIVCFHIIHQFINSFNLSIII
jgi:hypothetical protein